jgi:hypothetical protein
MSRLGTARVAVIVASVDPGPTMGLARFMDEVGSRGEVVLVRAERERCAPEQAMGLRVLHRTSCRWVPELWREGLRVTDAPLVALTTSTMIPKPGWLAHLVRRLDETGAAAIGGPIAPAPGLSAFERAIYLHRYARYGPSSVHRGAAIEPPGENALYRRDLLTALSSHWKDGFWEAAVHPALRARGEALAFTEGAVVDYKGGDRLVSTLRRRLEHARHYGAWRLRGSSAAKRLARTLAAPAVPILLFSRIIRALEGQSEQRVAWLRALPPLALLLTAWSFGEAVGFWAGPPSGRQVS